MAGILAVAACLLMQCLPQAAGAGETVPPAQTEAKLQHSISWKERLKDSGVTGVFQLALSVFGAAYVFERLINLRRKNLVPAGLSDQARILWREGRFPELEELGERQPSTLARAISFVAKNRRAPAADVSGLCGELVSRELAFHHQRTYPLGIVASLGPLLGLLGMILGMIETFEVVSASGSLGDPVQLASGISEALVTTALGLAIAIPFLGLYHSFKYRTSNYGLMLEEEMTSLIHAWLMKKEEPQRSGRRGSESLAEVHP